MFRRVHLGRRSKMADPGVGEGCARAGLEEAGALPQSSTGPSRSGCGDILTQQQGSSNLRRNGSTNSCLSSTSAQSPANESLSIEPHCVGATQQPPTTTRPSLTRLRSINLKVRDNSREHVEGRGSSRILLGRTSLTPSKRGGSFKVLIARRPSRSLPSTEEGADSTVCGFMTIPEGDAIHVDAKNVAPFSLPQEALSFQPTAEAVIAHFRNGEEERKIHCNVELRPEEQERLKTLRDLARSRGRPLFPCVAAAASRYLSRNRGDARKALRDMLATQDWRQAYFKAGPIADSALEADLSHGIAYIAGRDRFLRPALVIRPARVPASWFRDKKAASDRIVGLLVFCMEYLLRYMVAPGRAEGGIVLMDLAGLTLSQVPMSALTSICTVMANHYVNRVFRFYVLNVTPTISRVAGMGLRLLTERQRQKLHIVTAMEELREEFALHQLESDFGGSRPVLTEFFPFPLQAGPFEAGYAGGPNPHAVPRVHEAITQVGMRGRIWDPELSAEENSRLECTEKAEEVFRACGLELPTRRPLASAEDPGRLPGPEQEPQAPLKMDALSNVSVCRGEDASASKGDVGMVDSAERDELCDMDGDTTTDGEEPSLGMNGTNSTVAASTDRLMEEEHSSDGNAQVTIQEAVVEPRQWFFCMPSCKRS